MKFYKYLMLILLGMIFLVNCSKEPIHERVLTVDTHVDTPFMLSRSGWDIGESHDPENNGGRVDFPRMKQGGLDAIFFAVFVGQGSRTPEGNSKVKKKALRLIDDIHKAVKEYPDLAELAVSPDDAYQIEKKGKRAIFIGIENGYAIGRDLKLIKKYYDLGTRYITLCHMRNNDICDSSTDEAEHDGLTGFGKNVVKEMNRLGIMIDVSHISDKSFYDVIKVSETPVIASHSCARFICDSPRNLNDEMLKKLAENNGVIQVCLVGSYVKELKSKPERVEAFKKLRNKYKDFSDLSEEQQEKAQEEWIALEKKYPQKLPSISDFVDHIDHIVKVAGINQVGIGSDFDGGGMIEGCRDVSEFGNITTELVSRGYTDEEIRKIWGGNLMRVFREVEDFAKARDNE